MSRVHGEPVEVWVRDDRPARFVWRGRLYTVTRVLEHWMTTREWWQRQEQAEAAAGARKDRAASVEREFWRVEAGTGLAGPLRDTTARATAVPASTPAAGIYELRHDIGSGGWLLSRTWD